VPRRRHLLPELTGSESLAAEHDDDDTAEVATTRARDEHERATERAEVLREAAIMMLYVAIVEIAELA
jgi:hypothetical protein